MLGSLGFHKNMTTFNYDQFGRFKIHSNLLSIFDEFYPLFVANYKV